MPTLDFKGKQFIYSHHHSVPFRELEIDEKKSLPAKGKKAGLDDNLIIHGDNLHALKALMPQYAGKIKCIYIDPPYNTGSEGWCYNDNVNSPLMKDWLAKHSNPVDKEDLQRHDKWLCMMWPRLKLLHELLAEDGVIFVSIDDNEEAHIRIIMDEIFLEENFMGKLPRRTKAGGGSAASDFAIEHDYVLVFAKNKKEIKQLFVPHDPEYAKRYKEEDDKGKYFWDTMERSSTATKPYKIEAPDGTMLSGKWFRSEETFKDDLQDGEVRFLNKKDGTWSVQFKQRIGQGRKIRSLIENEFKSNQDEFRAFGIKQDFAYPKPVSLLKELLRAATEDDSIILDSFAGSGTTAHAVLDLNKEDGGNRKFILVEMEDYADSTTAERVRRAIKGVPTAKDAKLKEGLGGSFAFCNLGKSINIEEIITGETLPDYGALAKYVFYTATGHSLAKEAKPKPDFFVGETDLYKVYLIYKPDIAFLRGNESALNDAKLKAIAERGSKKEKLVFSTAKYMGQKELSDHNITFCQLPYAIHKVVGA